MITADELRGFLTRRVMSGRKRIERPLHEPDSAEAKLAKKRNYHNAWAQANPEKIAGYKRKWVKKNAARQQAAQKAWREANRERVREQSRRSHRKYRALHRDEINAKRRAEYAARKESKRA